MTDSDQELHAMRMRMLSALKKGEGKFRARLRPRSYHWRDDGKEVFTEGHQKHYFSRPILFRIFEQKEKDDE